MLFWKRQNYGDNKKIRGCQEAEKWMNRLNTEALTGSEKYSRMGNDGYMLLHTCPNSQNVQDQE